MYNMLGIIKAIMLVQMCIRMWSESRQEHSFDLIFSGPDPIELNIEFHILSYFSGSLPKR